MFNTAEILGILGARACRIARPVARNTLLAEEGSSSLGESTRCRAAESGNEEGLEGTRGFESTEGLALQGTVLRSKGRVRKSEENLKERFAFGFVETGSSKGGSIP
eukprot:CAMPEP_0170499522 /NCGR_PEP_ID=MMETSP0208-20121228/31695_1 /TAXON_ID=197538 /ORGANISM="Strombidium inclinatum, Strain S3" /LENGTH=105 /DNA_ID=CAMNT_0010777117 /DNA_START=1327 /DNA_END=1644 /DNA_ORIENTATION=+